MCRQPSYTAPGSLQDFKVSAHMELSFELGKESAVIKNKGLGVKQARV